MGGGHACVRKFGVGILTDNGGELVKSGREAGLCHLRTLEGKMPKGQHPATLVFVLKISYSAVAFGWLQNRFKGEL